MHTITLYLVIAYTPIFAPLLKGISLYQEYISSRQGDVCNFTPSCSQFAYEAIDRKGLLGIIMTFDRLQRCNYKCWSYAGKFYDIRYSEGRGYKLYDPITWGIIHPPMGFNTSKRVNSFADYLYGKGEWRASILEYMDELAEGDTNDIYMKMGCAYWAMGERKNARDYLKRVNDDTSRLFVGITWLEERKVDSAFYYLRRSGCFTEEANGFLFALNDFDRKIPTLAGILSAILPGSGRVYSGFMWDGLFSFLLFTGSVSLSYLYYREDRPLPACTFLSLASLFYISDIYGSVRGANLYNDRYYDTLVLRFRDNINQLF